jgi:lysyl-tRNA synthetase class II
MFHTGRMSQWRPIIRLFLSGRGLSMVIEGKMDRETSLRERALSSLKEQGSSLYPYYGKPFRSCSIKEIENYHGRLFRAAQWDDKTRVAVTGRISTIRELSSKLVFYVIEKDGYSLQIMVNQQHFENISEFRQSMDMLRRGDIIEVFGVPGKTQTGQLSLKAHRITLLAPCLHRIPEKDTLHDPVSCGISMIPFYPVGNALSN